MSWSENVIVILTQSVREHIRYLHYISLSTGAIPPSGGVLCYAMNNYETTKWKKKREKILRRDKYLCQESKRYGRMVQADTVHHIFPVEQYPEYMYCDWNLISLCKEQHNAMHDRDTHKLSAKGLELMNRTATRISRPFRPKQG